MKYRVVTNLFFDGEADAKAVFDEITKLESKVLTINDEIISNFEYHKCYHDEDPTKPCEIIKRTVKLVDGSLSKVNKVVTI